MRTSLVITHAVVITMDGSRPLIDDGAVAVSGNRIVDVDRTDDLLARHDPTDMLDAQGAVLLPGLINTHIHSLASVIRGSADDIPMDLWLTAYLKPAQRILTSDEAYLFSALTYAEAVKSGTTCCLDMDGYSRRRADAAIAIGVRTILAPSVSDRTEMAFESYEENEQLIVERNGHINQLAKVWFGIEYLPNSTPALYERVRKGAAKYSVGIHTHAGDSNEVRHALQTYGKSTVELYADWGILGANVVLAHCINLTEKEIDLLGRTGTHVAHCPQANMKLAMGIAPIPELMQAGVNVSLGTDGSAEGSSIDMLETMKFAAHLHKVSKLDPTALGASQILEMATLNGARALGMERELGSIEIGKKADMILMNLDQLRYAPRRDKHLPSLLSRIVYAGHSDDIQTAIIDGQVVMRDRVLLTIDEEQLMRTAEEQFSKFATRLREVSPYRGTFI